MPVPTLSMPARLPAGVGEALRPSTCCSRQTATIADCCPWSAFVERFTSKLTSPPRDHYSPIGMSVIAQAIADRQSEIDRLQAEIKALSHVERLPSAQTGEKPLPWASPPVTRAWRLAAGRTNDKTNPEHAEAHARLCR